MIGLDADLQVLSVRLGDVAIPWTPLDRGPDGAARIACDFPEPLEGVGKTLQILAEAPLPLGEKRRLPACVPKKSSGKRERPA